MTNFLPSELLRWMENLDRYGFVLVRNVPVKEGPVHDLQVKFCSLARNGSVKLVPVPDNFVF